MSVTLLVKLLYKPKLLQNLQNHSDLAGCIKTNLIVRLWFRQNVRW